MDKDKLKRYLTIAAICFGVFFLSITYFFILYRNNSIGEWIYRVASILRPLTIGAILAYIMKSTCNFFESRLSKALLRSGKRDKDRVNVFSKFASVILTYIVWIAAIAILLLIAIPQIVKSVTDFANMLITNMPGYINKVIEWEGKFLEDQEMLRPYFDKIVTGITDWMQTDLVPWIQTFVTSMIPKLLGIVTSVVDIVIGFVISVFILFGRKILARKSYMLLHCIFKKEKTVNVIIDEFRYADKMFSGFLEGKVLDSVIIGLIYYVALELLNVPYPALIAVICGVTNIIPIFGPFIGAVPSGLIILAVDPIKIFVFVIFVCVIQFIDGYIIDPHIVGGNIKMSSFWVIFAVLLFGGLWGFMGLLIGVPTFAVIYDIFRKLAVFILKKQGKEELLKQYRSDFTSPHKKVKNKITLSKKGIKIVEDETETVSDSYYGVFDECSEAEKNQDTAEQHASDTEHNAKEPNSDEQ